MAKPKRNERQRAADLVIIEELTLKGWTAAAIAAHISDLRPYSLTSKQISYDVKQLEISWRDRAMALRAKRKYMLLMEINVVRSEAWRAWKMSMGEPVAPTLDAEKQRAKIRKKHKTANPDPTPLGGPKKPDSTFLRIILDCNKREAELFGFDAAARLEMTQGTIEPGAVPAPLPTAVQDAEELDVQTILYLPHKKPIDRDEPVDVETANPDDSTGNNSETERPPEDVPEKADS